MHFIVETYAGEQEFMADDFWVQNRTYHFYRRREQLGSPEFVASFPLASVISVRVDE